MKPKCKKATDDRNAIFVKAVCSSDQIMFPKLGFTSTRAAITWTIVFFDLLICLVFVCSTYVMHAHISSKNDTSQAIPMANFAVQISNLPPKKSNTAEYLNELEDFIRKSITQKENVSIALNRNEADQSMKSQHADQDKSKTCWNCYRCCGAFEKKVKATSGC